MTVGQRAATTVVPPAVAVELKAKERQRAAGGDRKSEAETEKDRSKESAREAAKMVGVAHSSVTQAEKIKQEDPELFQKVAAGGIALDAFALWQGRNRFRDYLY